MSVNLYKSLEVGYLPFIEDIILVDNYHPPIIHSDHQTVTYIHKTNCTMVTCKYNEVKSTFGIKDD